MKNITLIFFLLFLIGCENSKEVLHERIKQTISTYLLANHEKDVTFEELKILKIDTVTPLSSLKIDVELLMDKHFDFKERIQLGIRSQEATKQLGNLYTDISSDLKENYKTEYQEKQRQNMLMLEKMKANKALIDQKMDLINSGTIDSVSGLHYLVNYKANKIYPDLTFEEINTFIEITKDFKVFKR